MFVLAWRMRGWPEQSMGFDQWEALAEMALGRSRPSPVSGIFPVRPERKKKAQLTLAHLEG